MSECPRCRHIPRAGELHNPDPAEPERLCIVVEADTQRPLGFSRLNVHREMYEKQFQDYSTYMKKAKK